MVNQQSCMTLLPELQLVDPCRLMIPLLVHLGLSCCKQKTPLDAQAVEPSVGEPKLETAINTEPKADHAKPEDSETDLSPVTGGRHWHE